MLRLRVAAAVVGMVAVACGGTLPAELRTADAPPSVVPEAPPRDWLASTTTSSTTTTAPPPPPTTTTTTAAPAPPRVQAARAAPPVQASTTGGWGDPADPATWDRLAGCESGGDWSANTGNGYYGGIQFALSSWRGVGGTGYPHEASREVQIEMGRRLWAQGGWRHWPACSSHLGYR